MKCIVSILDGIKNTSNCGAMISLHRRQKHDSKEVCGKVHTDCVHVMISCVHCIAPGQITKQKTGRETTSDTNYRTKYKEASRYVDNNHIMQWKLNS